MLRGGGRVSGAAAAFVALLLGGRPVHAQNGMWEKLGFDKLQIVSLGGAFGRINPSQVEPAALTAISADYGEISPGWHVVVNASFWNSHLQQSVVQAFVDSLQKSVSNPNAHVTPSPISIYDVTFGGDVRYSPRYSGELKPFLGAGIAAHVINADGTLIKGTFVERSLDGVAAGLYVTAGVSLKLGGHIGVEGSARADVFSGFRSAQIRGGASYYFGQIHGRTTNGTGGGTK